MFKCCLISYFKAGHNDNLRSFIFEYGIKKKKKKDSMWDVKMNFNSNIYSIMAHTVYEGSSYQDNLNLLIKIGTLTIILNNFSEFYLSFFYKTSNLILHFDPEQVAHIFTMIISCICFIYLYYLWILLSYLFESPKNYYFLN